MPTDKAALNLLQNLRHNQTFSVGFDDVNGITGNEYKYSDLIAQEYGTEHNRIHVSPEETLSALPAAVAAMSEPMMSHDSVGFYLLSEQVTKTAKVVQSGQGADEVFGGYHWYPKLENSQNPLDDYAQRKRCFGPTFCLIF